MAQYPGEAVRAISRVETVSGGCHKSWLLLFAVYHYYCSATFTFAWECWLKLGSFRIMYEQHKFLHFVGKRFVKWYWQRRVHTSWCFMHYICLLMFIYWTPKANNQIYCWVVLYLTFWTEKSTTQQCNVGVYCVAIIVCYCMGLMFINIW